MCLGNACWSGGPPRSIAGWICRTGSGQRVVSRHWGEKQPCNLGAPIVTVDDMTPRWCCTGSSLARYRMTGGYRKGCCSPRAELATAPNSAVVRREQRDEQLFLAHIARVHPPAHARHRLPVPTHSI